MPIVIGIFCLLPLGIGLVLEYLCCRIPKRRIWRALPPALAVLFVLIVGVGRWNMWTSEEVSPVTQLILFPGLPGIFAGVFRFFSFKPSHLGEGGWPPGQTDEGNGPDYPVVSFYP